MLTDPVAAIFLSRKAFAPSPIFPLPISIIAAAVVSCSAACPGWCSASTRMDGIDALEEELELLLIDIVSALKLSEEGRSEPSFNIRRFY